MLNLLCVKYFIMEESGEQKEVAIQAYSKSEIGELYKVGWRTVKRWLNRKSKGDLSDFDLEGKTIPPIDVEKIFKTLGPPS